MKQLENIMKVVSNQTGWSEVQIKSDWRKKEVTAARHAFCYLAKMTTDLTMSEIGRFINRNHSTIVNSISYVQGMLDHPGYKKHWAWIHRVEAALKIENLGDRMKMGTISRILVKANRYIVDGNFEKGKELLQLAIEEIDGIPISMIDYLAADQKMFEEVNG